jgi:hypothetical protein
MPRKMARSATRPPFGLPRVPVGIRTSRVSSRETGKALIFTPVRESSGESWITIIVSNLPSIAAQSGAMCSPRVEMNAVLDWKGGVARPSGHHSIPCYVDLM